MDSLIAYVLRPGRVGAREVRIDVAWLIGFGLVLIATGIGLRDPWPADEPRFALIARDMVATHQWLIPSVGGDVYPDKPPLFFWLIALGLTLTHSLRFAFLLPSLLAAIGSVVLIYDLARRLWNREAGLAAGLILLASVQFVWQARQAQIDATLCFFTTLGLYGLLRHCLLGPQWKWYAIGWAAAGLGIITKGVGFLPLLVLLPYALSRRGGWQPRPIRTGGWRWAIGPLALIAAVSVWLVPMLLAAQGNPELQAYRDEILLGQTVTRYAQAWHHREPFWYFIIDVIPGLWAPMTALLPWLIPRWRKDWRNRDLRVYLPLAWVILVVLFFSCSSGKRGVYVLPALPALALATGPWLADITRHRGAHRMVFALACAMAVIGWAGAAYLLTAGSKRQMLSDLYGIDGVGPLLAIGLVATAACLICRPARGFAAYGLSLIGVLLIIGFAVNPTIDDQRSGAALIRQVEAMTPPDRQLGFVSYKEQYLLQLGRPITNFGHARWREGEQEAADAALWLSQDRDRILLVEESTRKECFEQAHTREVGTANQLRWFLVEGEADPRCVAHGRTGAAIVYSPPRRPS